MTALEIYMNDKYCECGGKRQDSEVIQMDDCYIEITICLDCLKLVNVGPSIHACDVWNTDSENQTY